MRIFKKKIREGPKEKKIEGAAVKIPDISEAMKKIAEEKHGESLNSLEGVGEEGEIDEGEFRDLMQRLYAENAWRFPDPDMLNMQMKRMEAEVRMRLAPAAFIKTGMARPRTKICWCGDSSCSIGPFTYTT
jgi:hypothetical protein